MAEKIKTYDRRRIDGGHNVVCNVGPNVALLDIGLRDNDVASSYSGSVSSSSNNVFTNNTKFSATNGFEEEKKEEEGEEKNMKGFIRKSKGFLSMNLSNPKGESFDTEGIDKGRSKVSGLKEKLAGGFSWGITLGFFNSSNCARVLTHSSR